MAKKSKPPRDPDQLAAVIADQATSDSKPDQSGKPQKNPAAVAFGRRGGLVGGRAQRNCPQSSERKVEERNTVSLQ